MKKVLAVVAAVGCLSAAGIAIAGIPAGTGVNGSLHDMTKVVPGTADEMGRVCVYCHTPHHAVVKGDNLDQLPLWNHKMAKDELFLPYIWATPTNWGVDKEFEIKDPLAGPSRLCMSCHDGVMAIDEHGEAFDQNGGTNIAVFAGITHDGKGRANLSRDLSTTHPIGFNYNKIATYRNAKAGTGSGTAGGASEIVPSAYGFATGIKISTQAGSYNEVYRGDGTNNRLIADTLFKGDIMTCATCHEVHNKENVTQDKYAGGSWWPDGLGGNQDAPNYFLYAKQTESLICLSCHVK